MPISFDGQQFEFQELVTHLKTNRKDIENPEAYVGYLEKEQGVDLAERFYEDDNGKWGKFFLISPNQNVNRWRVIPDSIPKRIRTFVGRPFISEPNLEHFGAENMKSPLEIINKQEEFRVGTIKDVQYDEKTGEADAVVLFDDSVIGERTWKDMKSGNAFYVSPAIAGEFVNSGDERIYKDWFGLHLARVAKPAFDVFHASLKATCEGDERKCVQNLIATASAYLKPNDSLKINGFSCANNMENMNDPETPFEETEAGKAIAALAGEIKEMKDKIETSYEQLPNKTSEPSMKGQTTPVNDANSDGKQAQAAVGMDDKEHEEAAESEEMKKVKAQAQAAEDDLKERLSQDVLETESAETDLMGETPRTAAEEEKRKTELSMMDIPSLKKESAAATASLQKISAMASKMGKSGLASTFQKTRLVRQPTQGVGTAASTSYKSTRDIKGGWM